MKSTINYKPSPQDARMYDENAVSARRVITNVLRECKERLTNMTSELEEHLQ
jgi:Glu-tRNA(Gln) amidotransferase subunit E-like FAD-binding protein